MEDKTKEDHAFNLFLANVSDAVRWAESETIDEAVLLKALDTDFWKELYPNKKERVATYELAKKRAIDERFIFPASGGQIKTCKDSFERWKKDNFPDLAEQETADIKELMDKYTEIIRRA